MLERGYANFGVLRYGEVRRIYLPRAWMHKERLVSLLAFRVASGRGHKGDVKDLDVVVAKAVGQKATLRGTRLRKQAPNQDEPGRVDVVHLLEVEEDSLRVFGLCLRVGGVQGFLGEAVDLAMEVEHGATRLLAHACLKVVSRHRLLPSGL